ncbi:MAG: alpha-1,2-fucosyltransferase [Dehalococcoidia bacterium]
MADNSLKSGGAASWREWPHGGAIRPILSTRVERKFKRIAARRGRSNRETEWPPGFDLSAVYQHAASPNPHARAGVLRRAFRVALESQQAIDATFAALALVTAAGDSARMRGLIGFLELCYVPEDLEAGVARMAVRLREYRPAAGSALSRLECNAGWAALAASVRELANANSTTPIQPRWRFPWRLGPRRVVARLSGGLGNQMFQYAAALAYARRIGAPLRLDLASYEEGSDDREFLIGRLRVPIKRANSFEVLTTRLRPHWERLGTFDEFLFQDHGSAWVCGFWEDEVYFADIVSTVLRRYRPRNHEVVLAAENLVERSRNSTGPVVGVHLRRGDRAPGGQAFAPFSTLPAEYYREAAKRFPADANFLVFSDSPDDIAWCREHLGLGEAANLHFSDGRDPILDLWALTLCDHVILSSGTFSWWAGYLGERSGRRVIVPNGLQALSAERVIVPLTMPPRRGWEVITLPPGIVI